MICTCFVLLFNVEHVFRLQLRLTFVAHLPSVLDPTQHLEWTFEHHECQVTPLVKTPATLHLTQRQMKVLTVACRALAGHRRSRQLLWPSSATPAFVHWPPCYSLHMPTMLLPQGLCMSFSLYWESVHRIFVSSLTSCRSLLISYHLI